MNRYEISYSEGLGGETLKAEQSGYDVDDAVDRFLDSFESEGGSEGVRVLATRRVRFPGARGTVVKFNAGGRVS